MAQNEALDTVVSENLDKIMNTGNCPVCLSKVLIMGTYGVAIIVCPKCEWEIPISMDDVDKLLSNIL